MWKFILVVLVFAGAVASIPALNARVMPLIEPITSRVSARAETAGDRAAPQHGAQDEEPGQPQHHQHQRDRVGEDGLELVHDWRGALSRPRATAAPRRTRPAAA